MDISKIRKKARQKETTAAGPSAQPVSQEGAPIEKPKEAAAPTQSGSAEVEEFEALQAIESPQPEPAVKAEPNNAQAAVEDGMPALDETAELQVELLTFTLGDEEFAFRVSEVEEIIRHQAITFVPTMPAYMLGVTSLRGKIIPVIDLRKKLKLAETSIESSYGEPEQADEVDAVLEGLRKNHAKILVVAGSKGLAGAVIDRVLGVIRVPDTEILEPPGHLTEDEMRYISGVVIFDKRFISIIRSEEVLAIEAG